MACSDNSLASFIFVKDFSSYGLIAFVSIGIVLYFIYIILYIRNNSSLLTSLGNVYLYFSQISLFFLLLSPISFLFRVKSTATNALCSTQTLTLQILPFCLLIGLNVYFAHQWLLKLINPLRKSYLIGISSFLIFFLAILIQTAILLVWFFNNNSQTIIEQCTEECHRPLFLYSLSFNYFLLFLYSFQSSLRYHFFNRKTDFIYLLTSLLALGISIIWICLYLFLPMKPSFMPNIHRNSILAYGTLCFAYTFIGLLLYQQLFYRKDRRDNESRQHSNRVNRMTFKCLSLTKEQQRVFMAAYIKRNLETSCENLKTKTMATNQTRHSTLTVESFCPTLISTVSSDSPAAIVPMTINDTSSCGTLTSEYLLLSNSTERK